LDIAIDFSQAGIVSFTSADLSHDGLEFGLVAYEMHELCKDVTLMAETIDRIDIIVSIGVALLQ
jgi:hypothetical protein